MAAKTARLGEEYVSCLSTDKFTADMMLEYGSKFALLSQ